MPYTCTTVFRRWNNAPDPAPHQFGAFLETTHPYSKRRRNRRRPGECRALRAGRMAASGIICRGIFLGSDVALTRAPKVPPMGTLVLLIRSFPGPPQSTGARFHRARTLFGVKPAGGGCCVSGCRNAPNNFRANPSTLDRAKCPERGNTAPLLPVGVPREVPEGSVSELRTLRGALTPGFPPPRGIGDSPCIMHDNRGCDTHAYRGALACFKRRALPAEIPARGEEFGLAHDARVCLDFRWRSTLKERAATFKRRLCRL